jgi:hypothetical protein
MIRPQEEFFSIIIEKPQPINELIVSIGVVHKSQFDKGGKGYPGPNSGLPVPGQENVMD